MCRMIGFIMFWIALGMIISMFIESVFISVSIIFLLIICAATDNVFIMRDLQCAVYQKFIKIK